MKTRVLYLFLMWVAHVALVSKLRHGRESCGRTGISGNDYKFTVTCTRFGKLEVIWCIRRLSILVGAKESNIEVVSRISKIVVVAAKKRDLLLRCKDDS